jgi:hypothetical protein
MADLLLLRSDRGVVESAFFVRRLLSRPRASRRAARAKCGGRLSASFPSFADAAAALAGNEGGGHSNPAYIKQTVRDPTKARPSDYPALFYIQGLLLQIRSVFDLAGGLGNAFLLLFEICGHASGGYRLACFLS